MRHVTRGGTYLRVADPSWADALDGASSAQQGGRWSPPGGQFPVVYLNRDRRVARANVARKFRGRPYAPEMLRAEEAAVLVHTAIREEDYVDVVTDEGCTAVGLPRTYPWNAAGQVIGWERCQSIGRRAWEAGELGIACRSAAPEAPVDGEELAWFQHEGRPHLVEDRRQHFEQWFWL
ncbi:MAG: RES family NAD+ phosphorylase [Candidatus Methylomirabilia bacterium]